MVAHLSVSTMIEKDKIASTVAFLTAMEIDVIDPEDVSLVKTLYLINNSEDVTYQTKLYIAARFTVDINVEPGSKPEMTVKAVDYTRAIQSEMQKYRGGIGFNVRMLVINSGNLTQKPEIEEQFSVIGATAGGYSVEFKLGAENPLARRFPFRLQFRDRCQWVYKGAECKYEGGLPTCDFTLQGADGCAVHSNSENFGAFPGIHP